jgi:hypothetical protein
MVFSGMYPRSWQGIALQFFYRISLDTLSLEPHILFLLFPFIFSFRFHFLSSFLSFFYEKKGKVIPLHTMEALGVRGGTAPTHS